MLKLSTFAMTLALGLFYLYPTRAEAITLGVKDKQGTPISEIALILKPMQGDLRTSKTLNSSERTDILQRDLMFEPRISLVQTGREVSFPNFDNTQHHVYSFSQAKQFEFPLYHGQSPTIVFDKPGIISVGCNIHDWMLAYIVISDSPYYGLSNEQGFTEIKNVPDGKYSVFYWSPNMDPEKGVQKLEIIDVSEGQKVWLTLDIQNGVKSNKIWPKKPSPTPSKKY